MTKIWVLLSLIFMLAFPKMFLLFTAGVAGFIYYLF